MSAIETVSDIGSIVALLGVLSVMPVFFVMNNNISNPNYPMMEVGTNAIKALVMVLVPTGFLGYLFLFADGLSR